MVGAHSTRTANRIEVAAYDQLKVFCSEDVIDLSSRKPPFLFHSATVGRPCVTTHYTMIRWSLRRE